MAPLQACQRSDMAPLQAHQRADMGALLGCKRADLCTSASSLSVQTWHPCLLASVQIWHHLPAHKRADMAPLKFSQACSFMAPLQAFKRAVMAPLLACKRADMAPLHTYLTKCYIFAHLGLHLTIISLNRMFIGIQSHVVELPHLAKPAKITVRENNGVYSICPYRQGIVSTIVSFNPCVVGTWQEFIPCNGFEHL